MPAENEFAGRVALVTGAAGAAIGSTTCRTLASYGAGIVVLDNHERRTHETAEAITVSSNPSLATGPTRRGSAAIWSAATAI